MKTFLVGLYRKSYTSYTGYTVEVPLMLEIPFAKNRLGFMVRANTVPRGLACNCSCPACGQPVLARHGVIRQWHFAHLADPCSNGQETAAHLMAKQIIAHASTLSLPPLVARFPDGRPAREVQPPRLAPLANCRLEPFWNGFRPDVLADNLAIEVAVSHPSDPAKVAAYKRHRLPALEISLPPNPSFDTPAFETLVLHTATRHWLAHPQQADAETAIAQQQQAALDAARRLQQAHDERRDLLETYELLALQAQRRANQTINKLNDINRLAKKLDAPPRPIPTAPNNRSCFHCNSPSAFFGFSLPRWNPPFFACRNHRDLAETHNLAFPPR